MLTILPADYELGRLLACQGKTEEAKHEFELVLSGNYLEVGASGRKGKYSLEVSASSRSFVLVVFTPCQGVLSRVS